MAIKFDPNLILPGEQPKVRSSQTLVDNLSNAERGQRPAKQGGSED